MIVSLRPATTDAERTFIVATWASAYKKSHYAGLICSEDWFDVMSPQFTKHLARGRALVAYEKTDPDFFYGWIAGDTSEATPVVFYVYVKEPYRRSGIARRLFHAFGVDPQQRFVAVCRPTDYDLRHKAPRARFNPNEVRYPKEGRRKPL